MRQTLSVCPTPPPQVIFFLDIQAESSPAVDGVTPGSLCYCIGLFYFSLGFFQSVFPTGVFISGFFPGGCGAASSVLC